MFPRRFIIVFFMVNILVAPFWITKYVVTTAVQEASSKNTAHITNEVTDVVDTNIFKNQRQTIQVKGPLAPDAQELILLVTSLGRGGSTWIGELLANTKPEVMYFFEPLRIVSNWFKSRITPAHTYEILSSIFGCQFSKNTTTMQKSWGRLVNFTSHTEKGSQTQNSLRQGCRLAETVLVKTIRMPLAHVETLLNTPSLRHLKIIYLARDPRPVVVSRDEVMGPKNPDIGNECPRIDEDVFSFHRLSRLYPGHFYFMRYEDMCQDPMGEAGQLWKFLQANHTVEIPETWKTFLHDHVITQARGANRKEDSFSTRRESSKKWYEWRLKLQNSAQAQRLLGVEKECQGAMEKLGYIPLHTLSNLQNLSMPFMKNYSCDFWNCWSYKF